MVSIEVRSITENACWEYLDLVFRKLLTCQEAGVRPPLHAGGVVGGWSGGGLSQFFWVFSESNEQIIHRTRGLNGQKRQNLTFVNGI
jgi:hypothetical protein